MKKQYPPSGSPTMKGSGTAERPPPRFLATHAETDAEAAATAATTELFAERSRTVITRNRSPDIPFEQSLNPYRGCEHGCIYCMV